MIIITIIVMSIIEVLCEGTAELVHGKDVRRGELVPQELERNACSLTLNVQISPARPHITAWRRVPGAVFVPDPPKVGLCRRDMRMNPVACAWSGDSRTWRSHVRRG
jgi:hypothetical protein